jgi:hypothetical protein
MAGRMHQRHERLARGQLLLVHVTLGEWSTCVVAYSLRPSVDVNSWNVILAASTTGRWLNTQNFWSSGEGADLQQLQRSKAMT